MPRAKAKGLKFVDAGVSGGVWGLENGYCLMVGGDDDAVAQAEPVFHDLAPTDGYAHVGAAGAGHFTKMVHNGIEYGLMQAYAEGFEVMKASEFDLDLHEIAGIWRYGSVVRSWLLELLYAAFEKEGGRLEAIRGYVEDSGEGRWTIAEAIAEDVPVPVITAALFARFASRQESPSLRRSTRRSATSSAATPFSPSRPRDRACGAEPAARRPPRPAAARSMHPRHLRRFRRPDLEEAAAGSLRARGAPAAAGPLRDRRRSADR